MNESYYYNGHLDVKITIKKPHPGGHPDFRADKNEYFTGLVKSRIVNRPESRPSAKIRGYFREHFEDLSAFYDEHQLWTRPEHLTRAQMRHYCPIQGKN